MENKKISELRNTIANIDLFICSASFERRCLSIINSLNRDSIQDILLVINKDEISSFNGNVDKFPPVAKKLEVSFNDSHDIIEKFSLFFTSYFKEIRRNIFMDITTFTHEGLLIVLKMLQLYRSKYNKLTIGYIRAKEYATDEKDDENKWLSKGIKSIRSVIGYPGALKPSKKNHLVILFGFELDRTINLIEQLDYEKVTFAFGSESDSINTTHYNINKKRHEELMKTYKGADKFEISLRDPYKTKEMLSKFLKQYIDYNNIIVPMSNKISTVGVALYAMDNPNVQLCYIKPKEYNTTNYSIPSEECYIVDLDLPINEKCS